MSPAEPRRYTGDIGEKVMNTAEEYTHATQEIEFTSEQHAVWEDLYAGVYQPHLLEHVCGAFHEGFRRLELDPRRIPTMADLNERIQPRTGWRVERTAVRYTQADDWYERFANRTFLITDYLRTREQMSFTPEPDMFHDIFGHLPYLTLEIYARIEDLFAPAYRKATSEEREVIKRLAWYSTEFGLTMEDNRIKVFGAGILSGRAELANTIMEIYRLDRDGLVTADQDPLAQIAEQFHAHRHELDRFIQAVNHLHQRGEMSSETQGWNVVRSLHDELGIDSTGYLGGEVILAPFDIETIATIPKTVYAFNPMFFIAESLERLEADLAAYLKPIAAR